ncbi:MAG: pentapeptide repeat-containing protein, partial [Ktedonobacteraceae bacterium]
MNNDYYTEANGEQYPLDRADVEGLLLEAGGTDKLNLSKRNLRGIDFSNFDLTRADLSGADLSGADLSGANLFWVNLLGANLQGANLKGTNLGRAQLSKADLSGADLSGTNLSRTYLSGVSLREANLREANLSRTQLSEVDLSAADLSGAILNGTDLSGADLSGADLRGADLRGADLNRTRLNGAYVSGGDIPVQLVRQLRERGVLGLDDGGAGLAVSSPVVHIRISEEPLTVYNVTRTFAFLSDFAIKCWLIAKNRFADLKEYAQTRDGRFAEEAHLAIIKIGYDPHFNMHWKVDISTPNVAEALVTAFDRIKRIQRSQEKTHETQHPTQKDDYEGVMAQAERGKREIEIATEVIAILQPTIDERTRAILVQMILPDLLQYYRSNGL